MKQSLMNLAVIVGFVTILFGVPATFVWLIIWYAR